MPFSNYPLGPNSPSTFSSGPKCAPTSLDHPANERSSVPSFENKGNSMKHTYPQRSMKARFVVLTIKKDLRTALLQAAPLLMFFAFASMAHADPVTAFFAGIQATALAVASSIAVIGIIIAAAFHIFGSGRMAETMEKVGVGCFLLGGAGAIATWLFGL